MIYLLQNNMTCNNATMHIIQGKDTDFVVKSITINTDGIIEVFDWTWVDVQLIIWDDNTDYWPTLTGEIYESIINPPADTESLLFQIPASVTDIMTIGQLKYKYRLKFDNIWTNLYNVTVTQ